MINSVTKIYDGLEVRAQKPLDVRTIVTYREDLYKIDTWPHDTYIDDNGVEHYTIYMKEGMVVTVTGDKINPVFERYMLVDLNKILNKDYSGWKFIDGGNGSGGGATTIAGNIDGGRADSRYSPNQIIYCGTATSRGETEDE